MRRIGLAWIFALALGVLAGAAVWQNNRDENQSESALLAARMSIGASLVGPSLSGWSTVESLACFRYRVGRSLDALDLCFDSEGRLLEALHETRRRAWLVGVTPTPTRAPIQLGTARLAELSTVAGKVATLLVAAADLFREVTSCDGAVLDAGRSLTPKTTNATLTLSLYRAARHHCANAASGLPLVAARTVGLPGISALATRLAGLARAAVRGADTALRLRAFTGIGARRNLRRALGLRSAAIAMLIRVKAQARLDRVHLTNSLSAVQ